MAAMYLVASLVLHPRWSVLDDPFSFFSVTRVMVLVGYVFSCLFVASATEQARDGLIITTLLIGLVTVVLADLGVLFLPGAGRNPSAIPSGDHRIELALFGTLFVGGWLWRLYAFSAGLMYGTHLGTRLDSSAASNLLGSLSSAATLGIWGLVVFSRRIRPVLLFILLEIAWKLASGSKGGMLHVLLPLAALLLNRRIIRVNGRFLVATVLLVLLFVGSFVAVRGYRSAVAQQVIDSGYENVDLVAAVTEIEIGQEDLDAVGETLSKRLNLAERFMMIASDEQRQDETWRGESYVNALLWFVPRTLWPDKPAMSMGRWFATKHLRWDETTNSEAGVTVWGEAYLNFGLLASLLIPALWIITLQAAYILLSRTGPWGMLCLVYLYTRLVTSLAANLAVPVAFVGQGLLMIGVTYAIVVMTRYLMSTRRSPAHWPNESA